MRRRRRLRSRRAGATTALVAVCLVPMIAMMALVLDGGMLMAQRRRAQASADAAALAAGGSLYRNYATDRGLDPLGAARASALAIAAYNGLANDGTNSTVAINVPPSSASASFAGQAGCAEVIVTTFQPRYFSALWGSGTIPIKARAVARVKASANPSLIVTDIHLAGALTLTGGAKLTTNSDILVDSDSLFDLVANPTGGAVNVSNSAFVSTGAAATRIVGNYNIPGWASLSTFFNLGPLIGQPGTSDPYASMVAPTTSGLTTRSAPWLPYGVATINPGVYNGGLSLGGGMVVTMNPGIYYMKGGGLTVANGATLIGLGVTIYTDSAGGALSFQGGTAVTLTAPSSTAGGGIPGIVYYQDRANSTALNSIANGSVVAMIGSLYAPTAPMTIAGGAVGAQYGSQFIVKSLTISNGVLLTITTPVSLGLNPSKPSLVE